MLIKIKAVDTLFFKGGKPFNAGSETIAEGFFPPTPSTLYGALRGVYWSEHPDEFRQFIKGKGKIKDITTDLEIEWIYYDLGGIFCYPASLDMYFTDKRKIEPELHSFKIIKNKGNNNLGLSYMFSTDDLEVIEMDNLFISDLDYYKISIGELNNIKGYRLDNYITYEPKTGIARDRWSHSSKEAQLYQVKMNRPHKLDIVIKFKGLSISNKGILSLGAEGKTAAWTESDYNDTYNEKETLIKKDCNKFKLIYLSPAIFNNGWLPFNFDDNFEVNFHTKNGNKLKLKLLTAAVGKYSCIGGWDLVKKRPKPMFKAIPAGSVYYFELLEGKWEDVIDQFHFQKHTDFYEKEGYGMTMVGAVND